MELVENMMKAVQSFYVDSRACVRVGNDLSEWFPVNVGLRQGFVMSPCILCGDITSIYTIYTYYVYMDVIYIYIYILCIMYNNPTNHIY